MRISGRVLVHETGAPVPNVIVAGYDADLVAGFDTGDLSTRRRLGSVVTDARGEFTLELSNEETDARAFRSDLVVAVHAPVVAGLTGRAEPLHMLTRARHDRADRESFVVYLPETLLRERGVPLYRTDTAGRAASVANETTDQRVARRARALQAVRQALRPVVERRLAERRGTTGQLVRLVGGRARPGRRADRFVPAGTDATPTIMAARAEGIRRLADVQPGGMTLRLPQHVLAQWGATGGSGGGVAVPAQMVEEYVATWGGSAVYRLIDPLVECKKAHQLQQLQSPAGPPSSPSGPSGPSASTPTGQPAGSDDLTIPMSLPSGNGSSGPNGATPAMSDLFAAQLRQIVAAIGADVADLATRSNPELIAADLAVELTSGPADVPSTHDFHSLQIAWEDVWTAAVDGDLVTKMADAYHKLVEVVDWGTANPDLSELTELDQFLAMLEEAIAAAAGAGGWDIGAVLENVGQKAKDAVDFIIGDSYSDDEEASPPVALARVRRLLTDIQTRLAEPYRFDVFKPCTHNFGIITTYRQTWRPLTYQVGELVGSIPLTAGEKRTYTTKRTVKVARAQKEVERALSSRRGESTETTRADAEIVRKASYSTNFTMTAEGGFNVGVVNASVGSQYASNQGAESSRVKRDFHEAVRKSVQEYRDERSVEISLDDTRTDEVGETGEISNENNELTVTYLFYELQRRFEISEQLHKVTPVVLVAFDVPAPDDIDEEWLLSHEWILRRVLLDDGLLPALDYLSDTFAGDELGVDVLRVHWETNLQVVRELHASSGAQSAAQRQARDALEKALKTVASGGGGGLFDKVGDVLFGDDDSGSAEKVEARRHAAQKALEWAEADLAAVNERLASAVTALQQATDAYTHALQRRLNRRVTIDQLRLHVKQNILYYLQAVWLHEPPDQRYLRVYDKEIEWPEPKEPIYVVTEVSEPSPLWQLGLPGEPTVKKVVVKVPQPVLGKTRLLHQVADIDNLLGFKGNYAIFPLKERNALTDYMMQSFLDSQLGVVDPDPLGEIPPPSEAVEIAKCAWNQPGADRVRITQWLVGVLNNQRKVAETVVVPTGQLFVEALPGAHPILEDFKLRHRQIDVHRAQAEALQENLEALRYAARIVGNELGDPEVQTQIVMPDDAAVSVSLGTGQPT